MAQTGFTPILIYASSTPSAVPSASNLTSTSSGAELALNYSDGKLFYKDSGGVVQVLAGKGGSGVVAGSNTQVQFNNNGVFGASSGLTWDGTNLTATQLRSSGLTSGRVTYASTSGLLVDSTNMTFNGTTLTVADFRDSSLTSGRVTYAGAGGNLTDSANLTFNGTSLVLGSSTANLGLGATPSAWGTSGSILNALQIGAAGSVSAENVGGAIHLSQNAYFDGANWRFIQTAAAGNYYIFGDSHAWRISIPGTAGNIISFTQAMTLSSSGNLGIGTTSPARTLHVQGSSSGIMRLQGPISGGAIEIVGPSNSNYIGTPAAISGGSATDLAFYVGSTQYMVIDNSGNVGIGTSSPSAKLQVVGSVAISNNLTLSGGTANGVAYLNASKVLTTGSGFNTDGTNIGVGVTATSGQRVYARTASATGTAYYADNGVNTGFTVRFEPNTTLIGNDFNQPLVFLTNNSEQMRLTSTGLGIGTSSPAFKLDLSTSYDGRARQWLAATSFVGNNSNGTGFQLRMPSSTTDGIVFSNGGNSAEWARIDAVGNLGLGVTPSAWFSTYKALQVNTNGSLTTNTDFFAVSNNAFVNSAGNDIYLTTGFAGRYRHVASSGAHQWFTAPSGTAGNTITFTQAMTLDASGNLGIGTSSPGTKLVVTGAGNITTTISSSSGFAQLSLSGSSGNSSFISYTTTGGGGLGFYDATAATERMRLDSSGNLGLGVTPSAWGGSNKAIDIGSIGGVSADSATVRMNSNNYSDSVGTFRYKTTAAAFNYIQNPSIGHAWFTAPSGTAGNAISFTQAMTLDASGNLLVNRTAVVGTEKLSVNGGARFETFADLIGGAGTPELRLYQNTNNWSIRNSAGAIAFYDLTGNAERARITSGGDLLVGTTANSYLDKAVINGGLTILDSQLNVAAGTSGVTPFEFVNRVGGGFTWYVNNATNLAMTLDASGNLLVGATSQISNERVSIVAPSTNQALYTKNNSTDYNFNCWNAATTGNNPFIQFITETAATSRGGITYNRAGGLVAYNTTSDYRAKDIIGPVANSGAIIDALKVYEGQMKGATQSRPMLVAHEAQAVVPYAVTGEKDAVNDDGTPKFQQMDVSSLVPLLLAEIQSLRARVAQLEAKGA